MIPVLDPARPEGDRQVSWQAFVQEFGEPKIKKLPAATNGWRIVRLEIDRRGPVGLIVTILKEDGSPAVNEPVAWYWPDADSDAGCGPANGVLAEMNAGRCISGQTKEDGTIDFAMGHGAYYFAPAIGPHAVWHYGVDQASEVLLGLGMLGGTEHWHYNVVFQWTASGEEGPTEQPGTTGTEEVAPAGETTMAVIDLMRPEGDRQVTWEAFVQEFGEPTIKRLPPSAGGWRIVRLEIDRRGPVSAIVTMLKEDGSPAVNEPVAWYWPDANANAGCGPANGVLAEMNAGRCISGRTKEDGTIDFAMGHGAYYFAPAIGPHAVWHYGADQASEVLLGLGMLGGTEHWHYNVVFQWITGGEQDSGEKVAGDEDDETAGDETTVDVAVPLVDEGQVRPPIRYDVPFPVPKVFKGRPVTRRGVHWGSQWYHDLWIKGWADWNWEDWTRWAQEMHLSWAVLLSSRDSALSPHEAAGGRSATQILLDAGIIPLVRIGVLLPRGFTGEEQVKMLVEQVAPHNVPAFVVLGNEFGDPREWKKGDVPKDWMERAFAWWVHAARICLKHDKPEHPVIVGFPDGPDYDHDPFQVVRELPDKGYLETADVDEFFKWWEEGKAFYAGHFYGLNRPPDYPDDIVSREGVPLTEAEHRAQLGKFYELGKLDPPLSHINLQREQKAWAKHNKPRPELTACWRSWELVADWMKTNFGKVLPMAVTEGGWTPGAIAGTTPETLDGRWPKPSPETVAKYTLYAFDQEEHSMFAVCPWVAAGGLMQEKKDWEGDAWRSTAYLAPELDYGLDMPVVQALRDNPPR